MAMAQESAEQKAATEKAAEEAKAAAEQQAAEDKAQQESEAKVAEETKAKVEPKARGAAASKGYTVTGAAVVLRTKDKAERYLYRGATVVDGVFDDASIKHALSVGLIEKTK